VDRKLVTLDEWQMFNLPTQTRYNLATNGKTKTRTTPILIVDP
jgi:hypothetical protein